MYVYQLIRWFVRHHFSPKK